MKLRLFVYSWRHCSTLGPYIEESAFECAIEISSGYRTLSRNTARRLFQLGLEYSNSESLRNLDFISFLYIGNSLRLYGKINGKEDGDITRNEFNNALDNNILPVRYSQLIIDQMFNLVAQQAPHIQGIDAMTFVFLDFTLRLFSVKNATRPYYVNKDEFYKILTNPLFPNKTLDQIFRIPGFNMTDESFQMFVAMNISQFYQEDDFLLKLIEIKSNNVKKNEKANGHKSYLEKLEKVFAGQAKGNATAGNGSNLTFSLNTTSRMIFHLLDVNNDHWLRFYDFAHMMQIIYIFNKNDHFQKGRLTVGKAYDVYKSYSDFPKISYINRKRAMRLEAINQDYHLNVFQMLVLFKIDDVVAYYHRISDHSTLYEVDIKRILNRCGLRMMPDSHLNKCLRGSDVNNLPKYDWECSIVSGMTLMSQFYEAAYNYLATKKHKLRLLNTVFSNVDPRLN